MNMSLYYWLVKHPSISEFEWKQGQTWGSTPLFLALTVLTYLSLTYSLSTHISLTIPKSLLTLISTFHNLLLSLLSLTMALGCSLSIYYQMPNYRWIFCFPPNQTLPRGPIFFWANVFYFSKILEFVDTLLIILGGRNDRRRLSFLHVYHHTVVVVMCYVWLATRQSLFPVALVTNAGVHVIMYTYYLLCGLGKRPWWKRAVTDCQIVQFVFSFCVSGVMLYYHFYGGGCCGIWGWCFNAVFNASLLALFLNFHSKNYQAKKNKNKDESMLKNK